MKAKPILLIALLAAPAFGQAVYKCPSEKGIIYQQHPCPGGDELVIPEIKLREAKSLSEAKAQAKACGSQGIHIGMDMESFLLCRGYFPKKANRTIVGGITKVQFVYPDGEYYYFDNGILTAVQDSR